MKRLVAVLVGLALLVTGCSSGAGGASKTELTVFAAASLKAPFEEIGRQFSAANPDVKVTFNFAGSQALVDQLSEGAKADVLATADELSMVKATEKKLVGETTIFATNTLVLVTPPNNPAKVTGLNDSLNGHKLVICADEVPCGRATQTLAKNLGVTLTPVSQENSVTSVLAKVTSGEADAAVVYATDAKGAGDKVHTVTIDGADKVVNKYPIAQTSATSSKDAAAAFTAFVLNEGRSVMEEHGFGAP